MPKNRDIVKGGLHFLAVIGSKLFGRIPYPASIYQLKKLAGSEQFLQIMPFIKALLIFPTKRSKHAFHRETRAVHRKGVIIFPLMDFLGLVPPLDRCSIVIIGTKLHKLLKEYFAVDIVKNPE